MCCESVVVDVVMVFESFIFVGFRLFLNGLGFKWLIFVEDMVKSL